MKITDVLAVFFGMILSTAFGIWCGVLIGLVSCVESGNTGVTHSWLSTNITITCKIKEKL